MASLQLLNSEVGFPIEFLSLSFDSGSKRSASKLGSTALAVESEIELEHSSWPLVGNGESTFTLVYWGFIPSFPTKGQLEFASCNQFFPLKCAEALDQLKQVLQQHVGTPIEGIRSIFPKAWS